MASLKLPENQLQTQIYNSVAACLGHRRFGVCIYGESASNSLFRLNGFRTAIEQSGGELPEEFVTRLDFHCSEADAGRKLTEELIAILRRPDAPTALGATASFLA